MLPPAPTLFSTTTGWPSASPIAGASRRAMMSIELPGGKGATSLIGLFGHGCAAAPVATASNATPAHCHHRCFLFIAAPCRVDP